MSKDQSQPTWDARSAFHRATLEVHSDLGDLVGILAKEPYLPEALLALDEIADLCPAPEPGDADLIANLKDAVGRLRASLATVEEIRKKNRAVRWNLGKGDRVDRALGGIGGTSCHDCICEAATELLDARRSHDDGSDPEWFRLEITRVVSDKRVWQKWRRDLEREHKMAALLPLPDPPVEGDDDGGDASTPPTDPSATDADQADTGAPVKLFVFGADGIRRGGFFKDYQDHKYQWLGVPQKGLQECMLRTEAVDGADTWYRLELVLPRVISGHANNGSLVDHESRCHVQTLPQAMHWFLQQPFGPPPVLVERVTQFASDWATFCDSQSAKSMLQKFIERRGIDGIDPLFDGRSHEDLRLLQRLELVNQGHSGGIHYRVDSETRDMGVDGYITWMNGHMAKIKNAIPTAQPAIPGALGFHGIATSLLDQAHSIGRFRMHSFPEWEQAYPRLLPSHLLATLTEFKAAEDACRDAKFLHQESLIDRWHDPLAQQVIAASQRSPEEAERVKTTLRENLRALAVTTADREVIATREQNEAEPQLREAEQKLTRDWLADRAPTLRRLLAEYESQLAGFGPALPGLIDLTGMKLGRFGQDAASACEVLLRFATAVAKEQALYHFDGLDPDQLRVAVVKEIAFLVRQEGLAQPMPASQRPSAPPPPVDEMVAADTPAIEAWVPVAACIRKDVPALRDHTSVGRFCKRHNIETRKPHSNRREVSWDQFQQVLKDLEKRGKHLDDVADVIKTDQERRKQDRRDQGTEASC